MAAAREKVAKCFVPTAVWGQDKDFIYLTVNLADAKFVTVRMKTDSIFFKANGVGARGREDYNLDFDFYKSIEPEGSSYKVCGRTIEFKFLKQIKSAEHWQQLCKHHPKPIWLKVDFDRFLIEDSDEDATKASVDDVIPEILDKEMQKIRSQIFSQLKVAYLVCYNLIQAFSYTMVVLIILHRFIINPADFHVGTYTATVPFIKFSQILAVLEIIHPLFGMIKSGVMSAALQVFGRNLILFMIIIPEARLHECKVITLLFFLWSFIEVFRYPQYALNLMGYSIDIVTWLRYSIWIPLYPSGFFCEGYVVWSAIPFFDETGYFSMTLPNLYNFSFSFSTYLRLHIVVLAIGGPYMLLHMYKQRKKHLQNVFKSTKSKKVS